MRTTVILPDPLLSNAKRSAARRGVTLSAFVEDAVRAQLARDTGQTAPPFKLHTVRGRRVQPDLDLDRISALVTFEDESKFKCR